MADPSPAFEGASSDSGLIDVSQYGWGKSQDWPADMFSLFATEMYLTPRWPSFRVPDCYRDVLAILDNPAAKTELEAIHDLFDHTGDIPKANQEYTAFKVRYPDWENWIPPCRRVPQ